MTEHLEVAGLEFLVESRDIGEDGGPTIRVYGMAQGERVQLLRFDCFRKAPHYHYDPEHGNQEYKLDPVTMGEPTDWTLTQIKGNLVEMIAKAGYQDIASNLDRKAISEALPKLKQSLRTALKAPTSSPRSGG